MWLQNSARQSPTQSDSSCADILAAGAAAVALLGLAGLTPARQSPGAIFGRRKSLVACAGKKKGGKKGGRGGGSPDADASGEADDEPAIDTKAVMDDVEAKMKKPLDALREALVGVRAGKATPQLLDGIKVSAYESEMDIREVATITIGDQLTLNCQCFDEKVAPSLAKAIQKANMGYNPSVMGGTVAVSMPPLTKDKREDFAKVARDAAERSRVAVRNVRAQALKKVKGYAKQLSKDVVQGMTKELEAMVKTNIAELDKMLKKKEDELLKTG